MRRFYVIALSILFFGTMNVLAQKIEPRVCPQPTELSINSSHYYPLESVKIACKDDAATEWAREHLVSWYGECAPGVLKVTSDMEGYAYTLSVSNDGVTIKAGDLCGVRYALYTLRQLAIPKRGTETVEGWIVPESEIKDQPRLQFRGIHICWFPETEAWEVERLIRMAAYYKMNYAVIESWGTFRSRVAPWCGWPDGKMTVDEVKRLCSIASDLGIVLIPQMNLFGHATASRSASGKHATLDFNPQYQPLFEPSAGWNWCLTNPKTRELLSEMIDELMDAFGNPPYFHMGCDEANPPSCPECTARPYSEIFLEHIEAMRKVIARHGAKPMMWHDMFLSKSDDRWRGLVHNGTEQTSLALETLSRDIVICDWYYGAPRQSYPSLSYFKEKGFHVLPCPWDNIPGLTEQGNQADSLGLDGMLCTLWHHYYGFNFAQIYPAAANAMWNGSRKTGSDSGNTFYTHLRQIGWDMHVKDRNRTGIFELQIPDIPYVPY